jgi:hypothetical protein
VAAIEGIFSCIAILPMIFLAIHHSAEASGKLLPSLMANNPAH